jgi:hypothetical protein
MKYPFIFLFFVFVAQTFFGYAELELSDRLYKSEIMKAYRQQYQERISHLSPQLQIDEKDPKAFYEHFIHLMRSQKDLNPDVYRWYFLGVDLFTEQVQDMRTRLQIRLDENGYSTPAEVASMIQYAFQKTMEAPEYDGHVNLKEYPIDPYLEGNFPYLLLSRSFAGKEVQLIRMPVPARTQCLKKDLEKSEDVKINEEFEIFLSHHAENQKKHLYVNFISTSKDALNYLFHEKLVNLEQNEQFGKNFFLVSFDKDTSFYYQRDEFAVLDDSKLFLETFLTRLFSGKSGYFWSSHLDQSAWYKKCQTILTHLHENLFGSKEKLSAPERQVFIELTYSRIVRALLEEIQPDSCNLTCHYAIDRGSSTAAIFLFDLYFDEEKRIPNKLALRLIGLLVNQPLLLQNRPAHPYRIEPIIHTLQLLDAQKS